MSPQRACLSLCGSGLHCASSCSRLLPHVILCAIVCRTSGTAASATQSTVSVLLVGAAAPRRLTEVDAQLRLVRVERRASQLRALDLP